MDGDQPRRRGRPRRDAFIGPMNRPARWANPTLPRRATRAHREALQEQANGTIPHIEIGENGRPRLLNGDELRAENLQQLANGDVPVVDLEDGDEQVAPQPNDAQPAAQQQPPSEPQQDPEPQAQTPPQPAAAQPQGQNTTAPAPAPVSSSSSSLPPHSPPQFQINVQIPEPPSTDSAIADVNTPEAEQILNELQQPQVIFDLSEFQNQAGQDGDADGQEEAAAGGQEQENVGPELESSTQFNSSPPVPPQQQQPPQQTDSSSLIGLTPQQPGSTPQLPPLQQPAGGAGQEEEENVEPEPEPESSGQFNSSPPVPPQPEQADSSSILGLPRRPEEESSPQLPSLPQPPSSPSPPLQPQHQQRMDPNPSIWRPRMWDGDWTGDDSEQRAPYAILFANLHNAAVNDAENGERNEQNEEDLLWRQREEALEWLRINGTAPDDDGRDNGERNEQEEIPWQQRDEAIEWLGGNEGQGEQGYNGGQGGQGYNRRQQPPNEGEEDRQPPNDDEGEDGAGPFGREPSSSSSSSSSSDSDDDHDPEGLGRGYEHDDDDDEQGPRNRTTTRHPYEPVEGEWYFNDSQESLLGPPRSDEEEEGQDQDQEQQPQEPSSSSLPDFDDEQWEQEERALSRRHGRNSNSPVRWWERGAIAPPRLPGGDLVIMPERLANYDSGEHNSLRWDSRPSVDFGEYSRRPMLIVDWSSEEDWDEGNGGEENEGSNATSCTGSSSSSNGSGGSSDSDNKRPPVAMPVNGTRPASSSSGSLSSSVGRGGRGSSPPIQASTPPSSPPDRCLPDSSAFVRPLAFPTYCKVKLHKDKLKNKEKKNSQVESIPLGGPVSWTIRRNENRKKKTVPLPLDLDISTLKLSPTFERDMEERAARSGAPPPSAGISKATAAENTEPAQQQQQQQPSTETPATPTRKPSLRRNSAGPFQHSEHPSTTLFRSDFTFVPRSGRLSEPPAVGVVSDDDSVTHAMPDYIGQGDQEISPKTVNPPKVPQTGHALPGTREARPQVAGKGFPQVHRDGGVKVIDARDAYASSEEDSEDEEAGEEMTTNGPTKRRGSVVYDCPTFSAETHLLRQVQEAQEQEREQEREEQEEEEEEPRVGTYYQYNPRYDNEMGYMGGLTGSAVPAWIRTSATQKQSSNMSGPSIMSWVSGVSSTESSNATKSSAWSAKRSISSVSDYDDFEDDRVDGTPVKKRRLSPEPATGSPKRPRADDDEGVVRPSKRVRSGAATPVWQGMSANYVGIACGQQTDTSEQEQEKYDPAMTTAADEYDPKTVGLPRSSQGSPGSAQKNSRRQGSTEYDPAEGRQEEEYDPQHP